MLLLLCCPAMAVNEDVEGELVIYTSMYPFVIDMMNEAIRNEFPNLIPGIDGSFFFYGGTSTLITKIYGEMDNNRGQLLDTDMFMVAEPADDCRVRTGDTIIRVIASGYKYKNMHESQRVRLSVRDMIVFEDNGMLEEMLKIRS